ncbi:hypothetical protein SAMN05216249_102159 [Acetitomaculum ruminis DSM 5522]|uniref:AEC family transporter n=1 Tax=Acetitomaculum ruminis DSM 5522 TaxID=1120918 RepID=A0A1I0VSU1_9FIRM|nr:AEC family transporter [Acetitomaculum ruminis]SFA79033.1 hypothetical protein SAMN05216249_102159 [Acetitomaculum ruminis DSM 5522]
MDSFIYSINATIPVFIVMVLGMFLKKTGMLTDEFIDSGNKFNFKVTLPCLLLRDMANTDFNIGKDLYFIILCAAVTFVSIIGVWFLARIFIKNKSLVGAFTQVSYRSSAAVMGVAFMQNIYGASKTAPLMILGAVPIYNIMAVIILTVEGNKDSEGRLIDGNSDFKFKDIVLRSLINIAKNPILLSILAGSLISVSGIHFPHILTKAVSSVANMATPLAVVILGASFSLNATLENIKPVIWAVTTKLVILTIIFLPIAVFLGYRNEELVTFVIMLSSPATPSCYIMAKNMGNNGELTASVVVLTTLISSVTLTFFIYLVRVLGLV